jgi:hypothetical protein
LKKSTAENITTLATFIVVFTVGRIITWGKEIVDLAGYIVLHVMFVGAILSVISVLFRFSFYKQYPEDTADNRMKNQVLRVLTMIVMLCMIFYVFFIIDAKPVVK